MSLVVYVGEGGRKCKNINFITFRCILCVCTFVWRLSEAKSADLSGIWKTKFDFSTFFNEQFYPNFENGSCVCRKVGKVIWLK